MGRFYGKVGYAEQVKTNGVWEDVVTERPYTGDIKKVNRSLRGTETLNDNVSISTVISVVADPYAYQNFIKIAYVIWMDTKWKAASVDAAPPRLNITLGGLYNEQ